MPATRNTVRPKEAYQFNCDKCEGVFTTSGGLKAHQKTHENHDERELHPCPLCGRMFTRISEIIMHLEGSDRILCPNHNDSDRTRLIATYLEQKPRHLKRKAGEGVGNEGSSGDRKKPKRGLSKLTKKIIAQTKRVRRR